MTKLRTIAAVALASGTFGGMIGALATAAAQSNAAANTAATVQRVEDHTAEVLLHNIAKNVYFACKSSACRPPG